MSEEKSLTVIREQRLTPSIWQMIKEIAPAMLASRYFGVASPEAAMAIMLKGYEVGLSLTASFEFIQVIQGKPSLSPRGCLALIQQSPNFDKMQIEDVTDEDGNPVSCRVWMKRKNGFEYTVEYTMIEAEQAGLVKKESGWDKYPANMLRWRTVGFCADVVFPDVIGGMKRADELGADLSPEGDVWGKIEIIDTTPPNEPENALETSSVAPIPNYGLTLQYLLENSDDTAILEAAGGKYPTTEEEINIVAHQLVQAGKLEIENDSNLET